jgi:hypothetical protein
MNSISHFGSPRFAAKLYIDEKSIQKHLPGLNLKELEEIATPIVESDMFAGGDKADVTLYAEQEGSVSELKAEFTSSEMGSRTETIAIGSRNLNPEQKAARLRRSLEKFQQSAELYWNHQVLKNKNLN